VPAGDLRTIPERLQEKRVRLSARKAQQNKDLEKGGPNSSSVPNSIKEAAIEFGAWR
jgi:hypothetical protein